MKSRSCSWCGCALLAECLRHLAPGASLRNGNLSLLAFKTRSRFRYMLFLLAVIARRHTFAREVELIESPSVECQSAKEPKSSSSSKPTAKFSACCR